MKPEDKREFGELLMGLLELYGRQVTPSAAGLWWCAFERYPLTEVRAAFSRYTQDPEQGRYPPTPAAVLGCLPAAPDNARLSADEAWALCIAAFDESDTAITNAAIDAGRAAALPVWEQGDKIGARMAFKGAYERALASDQRVTWRLSIGWDREKRERAAERALAAGWLTHADVRDYLPAPKAEGVPAAIAGLLTGNVVALPSVDEKTRRRIAELRDLLGRQPDDHGDGPIERERFEAHKRAEIERLRKRMGSDGAA